MMNTSDSGDVANSMDISRSLIEENVERPAHFTMSIQGGMLEALGINMYTTLGKCLVEFVANAYDANSPTIEITVPVEEIQRERDAVRKVAKIEASKGGQTAQSQRGRVLLLALPDHVKVTIRDVGHGMTPEQVQNFFLPVNRKRREDSDGGETNTKTEGGKRFAMGRKGLGKLAGFGTAEKVTIETKRSGQNFATRFKMNYTELSKLNNLANSQLPADYIDNLPTEDQYTQIELSGLKCDAVRNNVDSVRAAIAEAFFGILPEEFEIRLNGVPIEAEAAEYEYMHPENVKGEFAKASIGIDLMDPLPFEYRVKFRKMGSHLAAAKRGARIYCNGRLAAGPTLLDLPTGMHNFHAQSYMECVVVADELDRFGVDVINTNRTSLRQDSELIEKFLGTITEAMKAAIAGHAKFREAKAERELEENEKAKFLNKIIRQLPRRTRNATKKLITTMAAQHGYDSVEFETIVPLVLNAANATEVLIKLTELGARPETIDNVAKHLRELAEIERNDALKLYRGRKNGVVALQTLEAEGEEQWRTKGMEKKLHQLLKEQSWLVRPEFARPIVSDQDMGTLVSKIAEMLRVDLHEVPTKDGKPDERRPDLVFVLGDSPTPSAITIIELKSPSLPLEHGHLDQLKGYMSKVEEFLETEFSNRSIPVNGILIGAMPIPDTQAEGGRRLLREMKDHGARDKWEVCGLRELIERARAVHLTAIETLEEELADEEFD